MLLEHQQYDNNIAQRCVPMSEGKGAHLESMWSSDESGIDKQSRQFGSIYISAAVANRSI